MNSINFCSKCGYLVSICHCIVRLSDLQEPDFKALKEEGREAFTKAFGALGFEEPKAIAYMDEVLSALTGDGNEGEEWNINWNQELKDLVAEGE